MARPTQNASGKPWSLTQIARHAGISMRTARTLVETKWLPADLLTDDHVLVARVTAALMDAPRAPGVGRGAIDAETADRYRRLLSDVYDLLARPRPDAVAIVCPTAALVADTMFEAMPTLGKHQAAGETALLLPVGRWAQEVLDERS